MALSDTTVSRAIEAIFGDQSWIRVQPPCEAAGRDGFTHCFNPNPGDGPGCHVGWEIEVNGERVLVVASQRQGEGLRSSPPDANVIETAAYQLLRRRATSSGLAGAVALFDVTDTSARTRRAPAADVLARIQSDLRSACDVAVIPFGSSYRPSWRAPSASPRQAPVRDPDDIEHRFRAAFEAVGRQELDHRLQERYAALVARVASRRGGRGRVHASPASEVRANDRARRRSQNMKSRAAERVVQEVLDPVLGALDQPLRPVAKRSISVLWRRPSPDHWWALGQEQRERGIITETKFEEDGGSPCTQQIEAISMADVVVQVRLHPPSFRYPADEVAEAKRLLASRLPIRFIDIEVSDLVDFRIR